MRVLRYPLWVTAACNGYPVMFAGWPRWERGDIDLGAWVLG